MPTIATAMIFISHASEDAEATRLLQQDLDERFLGAVRFFNTSSRDSLKAGEKWLDTIMTSLKESKIILPILSPAALRSPWVNFEAGGAWLNGATVIPCCGGQVRKDSLPAPYGWLQAINLDDADDLELLITRIAEEVGLRSRLDGLAEVAERMSAVFALGSTQSVDGFGAKLGDRIDELIEVQWHYRRADHDPNRWGAVQTTHRRLRVTDPSLESVQVSYAPAVEAILFSTERPPQLSMPSWERSSAGGIRIAEPHARHGGRYAFRIYFDPPLKAGDTADFAFEVDFPEYRLGTREDYVMAQLESGRVEIIDFQESTREIIRPTERFVYRVILPKALGASPIDPIVTRFDQTFADEQTFIRSNPTVYSVGDEEIDGEPCWVLALDRDSPPYRATYKLRWRLPSRKELV